MNKTPNPSETRSPRTISSILRNKKNILIKLLSVALALVVWQLICFAVGNELLLPSPLQVLKRVCSLFGETGFLATVLFSLGRILLGFLLGLTAGVLLALAAGRFSVMETLLWPYMLSVKSIPVASFIIIAFLWLSGRDISVLLSFLVVMPIIYTNLLEGIKGIDNKMLEMAELFEMPIERRIRYIWLPSLEGALLSGVRISVGMAWKAGVAAEFIGYPAGSIGEALYYSKYFFETVDVFAWTAVIVLLSFLSEKVIVFFFKALFSGVKK